MDRRPSYESLEELPFVEACLKEALRLYPPAPTHIRWGSTDRAAYAVASKRRSSHGMPPGKAAGLLWWTPMQWVPLHWLPCSDSFHKAVPSSNAARARLHACARRPLSMQGGGFTHEHQSNGCPVQASSQGSGDCRVPHTEGPVDRLRCVCNAQRPQVLAGGDEGSLFHASVGSVCDTHLTSLPHLADHSAAVCFMCSTPLAEHWHWLQTSSMPMHV